MTVSELMNKIKELDGNVEVYVYADHGQNYECAEEVVVSRSECTYGGDDMIWEFDNYEDCYDDDSLEYYDIDSKIKAICIMA